MLTRAVREAKSVTIGVTSDLFVKQFKISNFKFQIGKYAERKKRLERWLHARVPRKNWKIVAIDDPHEPAASVADLDAIIVTAENRARGEEINEIRRSRGLPPLALVEVPIVVAQDRKPISSTRVRNGEIDHTGRLVLPDNLRPELQKPLGRVLKRLNPARQGLTFIVTVGDVATKTFLDAGIRPFLAIIDGKVGRKPFHEALDLLQSQKVKPFETKAVKSGPGYISHEAIGAIKHRMKEGGVIVIDGEEDLLVLPALIHGPIGSVIYYGQPGEGLVEVVVTKPKQRYALALLKKFT